MIYIFVALNKLKTKIIMKKILTLLAIAAIFAACYKGENKDNDQIAKNKAAMQRFADEVINKHNPAMVDSLCTDDFVEHCPDPGMTPDRNGLKKSMADFFTGYPDVTVKTNFVVADSNMVVSHYTMTGTNSGMMMGMPPSGKKISIDGVDIVKFKDGKGCEHWGYTQEMKMMMQLGMMPSWEDMMAMGDSSKKKMDMKDTKMDKKLPAKIDQKMNSKDMKSK